MRDMMQAVCDYLHNDFTCPGGELRGTFTVTGGALALPALAEGQYFRLEGSLFNDGIWRSPAAGLTDETFTGVIRPMRVPRAVRELAEEIAEWEEHYGRFARSPYAQERFGDYAYRKAQTVRQASGGRLNVLQTEQPAWQRVFSDRLRRWRRL